jgi:hypothetical protein
VTHPPVIADQPGRPRRHRRRLRITRLTVLAGSAFLLFAAGGAAIPAAAAAASPGAPNDRTTHSAPAGARLIAAEPFGDYVNRLSFDVTSIDPALVTAAGPATLTITGTMTNAGPEPLTDLSYRFQRGESLRSDADVRQELSQPSEPTKQVQRTFTQIPADLAAGASAPFAFNAAIADPNGLNVDAPGVYPLMVNVNGTVTLEAGPLEARIGELHLLLTVMGVPGATPATGDGTVGNVTTKALPVNFVWPLVDRPHLGVGGVFLNDDLQAAVSPGGRLSILLDGLTDTAANRLPAGSVTVVIDPQLLDELDRMTGAYRVVAPTTAGDRAEPQPPMTALVQAAASAAATAAATGSPPTTPATQTAAATAPPGNTAAASSGGQAGTAGAGTPGETGTSADLPDLGSVDVPGTVAGTGQAAAASYLGRLREVAARYPVVVLPYGDPDVVALIRAGLSDQVSTAVEHGREVAKRVLGDGVSGDGATTGAGASTVNTSTAYPINGAADAQTLAALRADGLGTALLSESSVQIDGSEVGAAAVAVPGTDHPVPAVITQPDVLSGFDALIDQGRQSGWATRVNALTGVLAQQSLHGTVTPAVFMPDRRWSPDAPGLQVITELLGTLGASQVIAGIGLSDLAATASTAATTEYPAQARAAELSAEYLHRIGASRADVASLRQTFASTRQTSDPNLVLDPLDLALDDAASTAFRSDPTVGEANLSTVEATTAGLRTGVQISSAGNSYTLASSTSPLVLTVQNNLPYDVPVRVQISGGERVGLTVSDPGVQVVPAGRSQQVKIPAEVSRSGQFQVSAQLVGEDGTTWGPPVQLSVNSTAYGALTVILIVGAGGVLLLMVALRIVQRIRGRADAPGDAPRGQGRNPEDDRLETDSADDLDPGRPLRDVIQATDTSPTAPLAAGTPLTGRGATHRSPGVPAEQVGTDRS